MATVTDFLTNYIEPIAADLTPQQAQKILAIKPSVELVARVTALADKANLGTLSDYERAEYEYYVDVDDVVGLLQAKARHLLSQSAQ